MFKSLDLSARGRTRVVAWTVLGTLVCVVVAFTIDSTGFQTLTDAQRFRSTMTDIFVPILLATPVFFFFSSKLRELAIAHQKLKVYASTDSLTSLLNRGAFTVLVEAYLGDLRQHERGGALLVIDVDHFKRINDSLGHDRGDEALKLIAATIKSAVRSADLVCRMGGEEFGVFLPGSTPLRAELAGERIRRAISDADFLPDGTRRFLSVSVGGATFNRQVPFEELYRVADRRLYIAKEAGRNCVSFAAVASAPAPARAAA